MRIRSLIFIILLVTIGCNVPLKTEYNENCISRDLFQENFYMKKFEGAIGEDTVIMNLVRRGTELYGNYYITNNPKFTSFHGDIN